MHTWSKIKHKLENEYLAPSLRGHIKYFATSYSKYPDHEGRAAILLDGKQIIEGSYCYQWSRVDLLPKDEKFEKRLNSEFPYMDDTAVKYGQFDQRMFYSAFYEFDSQSIEKSLESENMLVRIFAVFDRRLGKRRLIKMRENIENEPEMFRLAFDIRTKHEGLSANNEHGDTSC